MPALREVGLQNAKKAGQDVFDAKLRPLIDPPLNRLGRTIADLGISANRMSLIGLFFGLAMSGTIAFGGPLGLAIAFLGLNRLADGLDGAIARATQKTDFGGYFDIFCDFIFYAAVPLAFVLADPQANAVAGAFLIASFYVNAASFLGYAVMAEKRGLKTEAQGQKSLYYAAGLLEGAETIGFFLLVCLFPQMFFWGAIFFGTLCLITATARVAMARQVFQAPA